MMMADTFTLKSKSYRGAGLSRANCVGGVLSMAGSVWVCILVWL